VLFLDGEVIIGSSYIRFFEIYDQLELYYAQLDCAKLLQNSPNNKHSGKLSPSSRVGGRGMNVKAKPYRFSDKKGGLTRVLIS
jgi:hypothetical protein